MAKGIPDGIRKEHILAAIDDLRRGVPHAFGVSKTYDLLYKGCRYPAKAVIGLAAAKLLGSPKGPYDFTGGFDRKGFRILAKHGFKIVAKADEATASNPDWTRDELILALNVYLKHRPNPPGKTSQEIAEFSRTLQQLGLKLFPPEIRTKTFRNVNGVYMKLMNLRRFDVQYTEGGKTGLKAGAQAEEEVWAEFAGDPVRCRQIAEAIIASIDDPEVGTTWVEPDIEDGIQEAVEGRLLTRKHFARERNRKLVQSKRQRVMKKHGKLACEACGFDFAVHYGDRGNGFIECHHTKPVAMLTEGHKTHIDDLALLCANCHRVIHRGKPWLSVEKLKSLIIVTRALIV
jgi:5-methylcytosine-specific restriction enzyme A